MRGLASVAAIAAAAVTSRIEAPLAALDGGRIHYEVIAVNDGGGLGGSPPYCAGAGEDLVMVTYRVTNRGDADLPAIAVPRLELIDDRGQAHGCDVYLSDKVEEKGMPLLSFPQHKLAAHRSAMQAEVFVTPRDATRRAVWKLRTATATSITYPLPRTRIILTDDCPRPLTPLEMAPEEDAKAPVQAQPG